MNIRYGEKSAKLEITKSALAADVASRAHLQLADLTDTLQEQEKPELALTRRGEKISADHRFESPFELEGETFTLVTTRKEHRAAKKNEIISEHSSRGE